MIDVKDALKKCLKNVVKIVKILKHRESNTPEAGLDFEPWRFSI